MSKGIINNDTCREFYDEINRRNFCVRCREDRADFERKDKKYNDSYSNMIPGFSSERLQIPIDVLIVAESHGGGRKEGFRDQMDLKTELEGLEHYYLGQKLAKYHQSEMRKLLRILNAQGINWVFTDLVKCFVWQSGKDDLSGKKNFEIATSHCSTYLKDQIVFLQPKIILSLGGRVSGYFGNRRPQHGVFFSWDGNNILHSTFPSRNTADTWTANGEWAPIIEKITRAQKVY